MRRLDKKNCLKQLEELDKAIQNSNKSILQENREIEELERLVAEKKAHISEEVKRREQNTKTFDIISEKLLDEKTIRKTVTYGLNKGILNDAAISIPLNSKYEELLPEQRRALVDTMMVQNKEKSFALTINKGIDFIDGLIDSLIAGVECQEDLDDDN